VAESALHVAGGTELTKSDATLPGVGTRQLRLIVIELEVRPVRTVNLRLESAGVAVEEAHSPKGQHHHKDQQPDRNGYRAGCRLDLRSVSWVRVGVHFTGGALVAAAGALVDAAGISTVTGASKITVSARRLNRYATS